MHLILSMMQRLDQPDISLIHTVFYTSSSAVRRSPWIMMLVRSSVQLARALRRSPLTARKVIGRRNAKAGGRHAGEGIRSSPCSKQDDRNRINDGHAECETFIAGTVFLLYGCTSCRRISRLSETEFRHSLSDRLCSGGRAAPAAAGSVFSLYTRGRREESRIGPSAVFPGAVHR